MVQADIRDDTQGRRDDVGTIQASAQSDLDYRVVYLLVPKIGERHAGDHLEERGVERFEERAVSLAARYGAVLSDVAEAQGDAVCFYDGDGEEAGSEE